MKPKSIKSPNRESDFVYNEFAGTFEIFIDQNNIPFVVEKRSRRVIRTGKNRDQEADLYVENDNLMLEQCDQGEETNEDA